MIKEISYRQLAALVENEGADLVDVREIEEFDEGALSSDEKKWPLSSFGLRQKEISQNRPTIFYCRSGMRSMKAAEIASAWTGQDLYSLNGGLLTAKQEQQ